MNALFKEVGGRVLWLGVVAGCWLGVVAGCCGSVFWLGVVVGCCGRV